MITPVKRSWTRLLGIAALTAALFASGPAALAAPPYRSDTSPDLVPLLAGYDAIWKSDGLNDLRGIVVDPDVLARDDELAVWINQHATDTERFLALQDSEYQNSSGTA